MSCRELHMLDSASPSPNPSAAPWSPRCPGHAQGVPSTHTHHLQLWEHNAPHCFSHLWTKAGRGTHQDSTREVLKQVLETLEGMQSQICHEVEWKILAYRKTCKPLHYPSYGKFCLSFSSIMEMKSRQQWKQTAYFKEWEFRWLQKCHTEIQHLLSPMLQF